MRANSLLLAIVLMFSALGCQTTEKDGKGEPEKAEAGKQTDERAGGVSESKLPTAQTTAKPTPPLEMAGTKPPKRDSKEGTDVDPTQGAKKLAKVWNAVDTKKLIEITKDWKDEELAPVMYSMDVSKVADFLAKLAEQDAKRSSELSKSLRSFASIIKKPT